MRSISIQPNLIYHVYNRGINREPIFYKKQNWDYFLFKLFRYFQPQKAKVIAYCLMPNHYHLLVRVLCQDFGKQVMLPFTITYTKAINKQENRVGPLFQGAYQIKQIKTDEEILQASRYIHLNPVKAGLVKKPNDWTYSSFLDYIEQRKNSLLEKEIILELVPGMEEYKKFVENGI